MSSLKPLAALVLLAGIAPAFALSLYSATFANGDTGFAGGFPSAIYKTSDGGVTWNLIRSEGNFAQIRSLAFADAKLGLAVGGDAGRYSGVIRRTLDGGNTWQSIRKIPYQMDPLNSVAFLDPATAVAVGAYGTIVRSVDSGGHWAKDTTARYVGDFYSVAFKNANEGKAVANQGNIYATYDGGMRWSLNKSGSVNEYWRQIAFAGDGIGMIVGESGSQPISARISGGGGIGRSAIPAASGLYGLALINSSVALVIGRAGFILRTVDGGATWAQVYSGLGGGGRIAFAADGAHGAAVSGNGTVFTTDSGATWSEGTVSTLPREDRRKARPSLLALLSRSWDALGRAVREARR